MGIGLAVLIFGFLAVEGRLGVASALGALVIAFVMRWQALWGRVRSARESSDDRSSTIETVFLRMSLHHESGAMAGQVLRGRFQGRTLDSLTLAELLLLLDECRPADAQSAAVLETYLDRTQPADWRARAAGGATAGGEGAGRGGMGATMTPEEALLILGLEPGASPQQIKEAHRRLMLKVHPDQGGSTYLAAKINQAKDLLLRS
jgi:DnaJ-domain-containing protein 1